MIIQSYLNQAGLLLQVIPHIATEKTLALKGGTAINLFLRNMPRLILISLICHLMTGKLH